MFSWETSLFAENGPFDPYEYELWSMSMVYMKTMDSLLHIRHSSSEAPTEYHSPSMAHIINKHHIEPPTTTLTNNEDLNAGGEKQCKDNIMALPTLE